MGRLFKLYWERVLMSVCEVPSRLRSLAQSFEAETSQGSAYCSHGDIPMRDFKDSSQLDSDTPP